MTDKVYMKEIIQKIKSGKVSPEEALNLYKMNKTSKRVTGSTISYYKNEWVPDEQLSTGNEELSCKNILLFGGKRSLIEKLYNQEETCVVTVEIANEFSFNGGNAYCIAPSKKEDYQALFASLKEKNFYPDIVLHLWSLDNDVKNEAELFTEQVSKACKDASLTAHNLMAKSADSLYYIVHTMPDEWGSKIVKFLYCYPDTKDALNPFAAASVAFLKSMKNVWENTFFVSAALGGEEDEERILDEIKRLKKITGEVKYNNHKRFIRKLVPLSWKADEKENDVKSANGVQLKEHGVYIITGGMGALGQVYAQYLVKKYKANLILIGRKQLSENNKQKLLTLNEGSNKILYRSCDICNYEETKIAMEDILHEFGKVNGVFHMAGMTSNHMISAKEYQDFTETLKAKVYGTIVLDEVLADVKLDFYFLFSSLSSILGDFGQCDYATGNRFLDEYVLLREQLRQKGLRTGKTIVTNWPLWKEGAMHFSSGGEQLYLQSSGMTYLEKEDGILALENIIQQENTQVAIVSADPEGTLREFQDEANITLKSHQTTSKTERKEMYHMEQSVKELQKRVAYDIKNLASKVVKIDPKEIDEKSGLGEFGFDSITLKEFASKINYLYKINLKATVFFSQSNLALLSEYIAKEFEKEVTEYYQKTNEAKESKESKETKEKNITLSAAENSEIKKNRKMVTQCEEIAIIGMSGRFPGADNKEEFWEKLKQQESMITEVPEDRWNTDAYYSPIAGEKNKSISKWGGFLHDVDKFDAKFFNIVPREAELMDPQQRLLIETVWNSFEDAGYKSSELSGKEIGVFVGMQFGEYEDLIKQYTDEILPQITTGTALNMLSNRISYLFNFRGPSVCIDTACSSSLVAIHSAMKALRDSECEMAVAGGVSLILSEYNFIAASQMGMQAPDGKCKAFDKNANGYVKGEGVGAVILKPLDKAIRDHDHIYGVLKGSWVNHGGRANSLTAPNSDAQAQLIVKAFKNAGVEPDTVSYIEAHGTGTELGDPVEIEGIKKAFTTMYQELGKELPSTPYCGIGSVKTNIGHLEPASGIASLIKVLLAFQYKEIPGLVNFKEKNPYIEIDNSPFYLVEKTCKWKVRKDDSNNAIPRRAGISAFGFGGTNAHILLEEYTEDADEKVEEVKPYLLLLSAKKKEQLQQYAEAFLHFLGKHAEGIQVSIEDISYTLQTGRESMEERVAFIASDLEEWREQLKQFVETGRACDNTYIGNGLKTYSVEERKEEYISKNNWVELAKLWIKGEDIPWDKCYQKHLPYKVSLPVYPFDRKRYWFDMYLKNDKFIKPVESAKLSEVSKDIQVSQTVNMEDIQEQWRNTILDYHGDAVEYKVIDESIALITMQDTKNRNMFSKQLTKGLVKAFSQVKKDSRIKAVVLTGNEKLFCMGGTEETLNNITEKKEKCSDGTFVYYGLLDCEVPVIAAMQGHAVGGGLVFGLFADIVVMAKESIYSCNFTKYGFTPGVGATYILKSKLGNSLATEMMFTSKEYSGEELQNRGASFIFANRSDVLEEAINLAKGLSKKPLCTLKVLKKELAGRVLKKLPEIIESEVQMQEKIFSNPSVEEFKSRIQKNFSNQAIKPLSFKQESSKKMVLKKTESCEEPPIEMSYEEPSVELSYEELPVEVVLVEILASILQVPNHEINREHSFKDLGIDSITGIELVREINKRFKLGLAVTDIYDYTTISKLGSYILQKTNRGKGSTVQSVKLKSTDGIIKNRCDDLVPKHNKLQLKSETSKNLITLDKNKSNRTSEDIGREIALLVSDILQVDMEEIEDEVDFRELGIDSISGVELIRGINNKFNTDLEAVELYDHVCIKQMADFIDEKKGKQNKCCSVEALHNEEKHFNKINNLRLKPLQGEKKIEKSRPEQVDENSEVMAILEKLSNGETDIDDVEEYLEETLCKTKRYQEKQSWK